MNQSFIFTGLSFLCGDFI